MAGALEALDPILHGVDGGTLTAPDAIEQIGLPKKRRRSAI
jgi:hypothetical protein